MPDSEYNRLVRQIEKARSPSRRRAPLPTAEEIAAIRFAQSAAAKNEWTRKIIEGLDKESLAEPPDKPAKDEP
jgi:hypothetical protein